MKSFVSLCFAILLPVLTLAIPLSQPDDLANLQQAADDAAVIVNSTALDSPFASAHHLGPGPVVQPSDKTVVHETYECAQRVDIEYLIDTVLGNRIEGYLGCRKVANAPDEAAAPPGDQPLSAQGPSATTGENPTDVTTTPEKTTKVTVSTEQITHGTASTTTIQIKRHINPANSPEIPGPDSVPHPIDPPNPTSKASPPDPVISIPDPASGNGTTTQRKRYTIPDYSPQIPEPDSVSPPIDPPAPTPLDGPPDYPVGKIGRSLGVYSSLVSFHNVPFATKSKPNS